MRQNSIIAIVSALAFALFAPAAEARNGQAAAFGSLQDFKPCLVGPSSAAQCVSRLNAYIASSPKQALSAAKLVAAELEPWAAMPLFQKALQRPGKSEPRCRAKHLDQAVLSALWLPAQGEQSSIVKAAHWVAKEHCWKKLRRKVRQALSHATRGSHFSANACPLLPKSESQSFGACRLQTARAKRASATMWASPDQAGLTTQGPARVFVGSHGERVDMVQLAVPGDYFLLRLRGLRGPQQDQVLLHRERQVDDRGFDYWMRREGRPFVSLVMRGGYWGQHEVFAPGQKKPVRVRYDPKASLAAKSQELLSAYLAQTSP